MMTCSQPGCTGRTEAGGPCSVCGAVPAQPGSVDTGWTDPEIPQPLRALIPQPLHPDFVPPDALPDALPADGPPRSDGSLPPPLGGSAPPAPEDPWREPRPPGLPRPLRPVPSSGPPVPPLPPPAFGPPPPPPHLDPPRLALPDVPPPPALPPALGPDPMLPRWPDPEPPGPQPLTPRPYLPPLHPGATEEPASPGRSEPTGQVGRFPVVAQALPPAPPRQVPPVLGPDGIVPVEPPTVVAAPLPPPASAVPDTARPGAPGPTTGNTAVATAPVPPPDTATPPTRGGAPTTAAGTDVPSAGLPTAIHPVPAHATASPVGAPAGPGDSAAAVGPDDGEEPVTTGGSIVAGLSSVPTHARGRGRLWSGLVWIPTVPYQEPRVLANPRVPMAERRCGVCGAPVGRGSADDLVGTCAACGSGYSFVPTLRPGDLVAGQYEVEGCLTRGGLGWLYLGRDRNLDNRAVVLKGLLNTGDPDAQEAAEAERRSLIELEHPGVVRILNFVEYPHPVTGESIGYIVMEYVGGLALDRAPLTRADPAVRPGMLPLDQAIAYAIDALAILDDMHHRGLLYCDFKEKNVMQVGDQLKLIDLGATCGFEPAAGSIVWGTKGYEAPEIEVSGPSVASDLYTVGRTLARLTLDCEPMRNARQFSTTYRNRLPDPAEAPLLAEVESYHRLLLRATDPDPARRFHSAAEMAAQLSGVLREVVSAADGTPHPAPTSLFSTELRVLGTAPGDTVQVVPHTAVRRHAAAHPRPRGRRSRAGHPHRTAESGVTGSGPWSGRARVVPAAVAASLPVPRVDLSDPGAGFVATLGVADTTARLAALDAAPVQSTEVRLCRVRTHLEAGDFAAAHTELDTLADESPGEWRIDWYRGIAALTEGDVQAAHEAFDTVYTQLPGEAAPMLAVAGAAECTGNAARAAALYQVVWRTDHNHVGAAFGLARARLALGDRRGAVAVLESVPMASSHHLPALEAAVRCRVEGRDPAEPLGPDLREAGERLAALRMGGEDRDRLAAEILEAALAWVLAGRHGEPTGSRPILDHAPEERALRLGLERLYRSLAARAPDPDSRAALVDRANGVRPWKWF